MKDHTKNQASQTSPNVKLAIWEYAYQIELERFWKIVTRKAEFLHRLKAIDLFELEEAKAMKTAQQIAFLEEELRAMVGIKEFVENLKNSYLETAAWLADKGFSPEQARDDVPEL